MVGRPVRRSLPPAALLVFMPLFAMLVACTSTPTATTRPAPAAPNAPAAPAASAPAAPAAPSPPPPLRQHTFAATTAAAVSNLPLWMGDVGGYFAEEGLELRVVLAGGTASLAALLSGDAQTSAAGETGVRAAFQGAPFVVVAVPIAKPSYYLYSQPEFTSVQQLKGQSIAITVVGTSPHILAMRLLRQLDGWADPAREVRWVAAGNQRVETLVAGAVQGGILGSPEDLTAERHGMRKHIDFSEHLMLPVGSINVTNQYAAERPDELKRFLRAHLKGLRRAHADPTFAIQTIQQRADLDADTATQLYRSEMPKFTMDNMMPESALLLSLEINRDSLESVARELQAHEAYDFTLASQVARELDSSGWKP